MSTENNQAFQQAPWRVQLQILGMVLLGFVTTAMVASIYLNISAQTATAAIETESLGYSRDTLQRQIASLRTEIGMITASREMRKRAEELGFLLPDAESSHYLLVDGYPGKQTKITAPPITQIELPESILKPIYTQSLWEWLYENLVDFRLNQYGGLLK
jgi:hypothetical protein